MGFTATFPVSLMLVAGCLAPCCEMIAVPAWWLGAGILVVFQIYALARWLGGGIDAAQINAGWMIIVLGGLPAPIGGLPLGLLEASRVLFGISLVATPLIVGLVFWRTLVGPAMPDAMRPSLFIFLVPPSLTYALYPVLSGETPYWVAGCFYFSLILAAALFVASRRLFSWPFGAPWAAFTFPLVTLAAGAIRHASLHPAPIAQGIAWIALALAGFFVALVLGRALGLLARGKLCAPPA
jgi:tellurite resistance protein